MAVRVLLAVSHAIVREALRALLNQEDNMEVVCVTADGRTAIDLVCRCSPDVVVMEGILPELNGVETTRQILAAAPQTVVVGLSINHDQALGPMMRAGASAYVGQADTAENLVEAIRQALVGNQYVSPHLIASYARYLQDPSNGESRTLTRRELEVLQLVTEGKTTREIASVFSVSDKTVRTQLWSVKKKLGLRSVASLTKYAIREGITNADPGTPVPPYVVRTRSVAE